MELFLRWTTSFWFIDGLFFTIMVNPSAGAFSSFPELPPKTPFANHNPTYASHKDKQLVINNLIKIIEKEYQKGNQSVSKDKIEFLLEYKKQQKKEEEQKQTPRQDKPKPALPAPLYPPIFNKLDIKNLANQKASSSSKHSPNQSHQQLQNKKPSPKPLSFKKIEHIVISLLESLANILDNLHLFSKLPMFPQKLISLLKQTNKLWVVILVFLIRKTISQLLNVIRKENKIKVELNILKSNKNSKLLEEEPTNTGVGRSGILRKYEKILKDLKFDKVMLIIELIGNFLDISFNLIELYEWALPSWFMNTLNMASMAMTIYRMNKDDEYVDDDISEDLI